MSEYAVAKGGKLKLKGKKDIVKKKKKKVGGGLDSDALRRKQLEEKDIEVHGGWTSATVFNDIGAIVAIEFGVQTYMKALDDGTFTLGPPHDEGEAPAPEEIFTAIRINEDKIALKSGYGKYLKVEKNGELVGRSDAVGSTEHFEPVFENEKMALMAFNGCFLSVRDEDDSVYAENKKAGDKEFIRLRSQPDKTIKKTGPDEESGTISQVEINYVKKFQKFQNKRMLLNEGDIGEVKKAKIEGILHETLLDRRSKMKADRYCK